MLGSASRTSISDRPTLVVVDDTLVTVRRIDFALTVLARLMTVAEPSLLSGPNSMRVPSEKVRRPPRIWS